MVPFGSLCLLQVLREPVAASSRRRGRPMREDVVVGASEMNKSKPGGQDHGTLGVDLIG